jgi:predicted enzyme related to lactoylglutathione lyase
MPSDHPPLLRKIDCIRIPVPDLEAGLAFYRDALGQSLVWRSATAAGLGMAEEDGELVIQTERPGIEVDFLVDSAGEAAGRFVAAGGRLLAGPFDIQVGRCAVVADPWGSVLVLLDMSKGRLVTDDEGNIVGNERPDAG